LRSLFSALGSTLQAAGNWLQRSASPNPLTQVGWSGGDSAPGSRGKSGWLKEGERSARLHAVWSRIAEDVAANPVKAMIRDPKTNKKKAAPTSRLAKFLAAPWKTMGGGTWFNLIYLTQGWLELAGEAIWLIRTDSQGYPTEVWPIPPHWLATPATSAEPFFWLDIPGDHGNVTPVKIPATNVLWFKRPSLSDPYRRGVGRASAVDDEVTQDELASKWESSFFRNGAKPDMVVFAAGLEDNPSGAAALRKQWDEQHRGVFNAHRPAFLPAAGRVEMLSTNLKEMAFVELRTQHRDVIWQNWAMSPEILGAVENSNRASAEAAQFLYAHNITRTRLIFLLAELERWFLPKFREPDVFLEFQNPVKETEELKIKKIEMLGKNGYLTRDEVREAAGIDPIGDARGEEILVPYNVVGYGPEGYRPAPRPEGPTTEKTTTTTEKTTNGRASYAV